MIPLIQLLKGKGFQNEEMFADLLFRLDDLNNKYRFMEMNLLQKKKRLQGKLPDIQICLGMIYSLFVFDSIE
jgi:hypothetical protein